MRYWMPSRRELVVEGLALLALPAYSLATSIADGRPPYFVVLVTLGTLAILLTVIALWEFIRQPFRRRVLTGKELIDTVDVWLRENGFGRTPYRLAGYSHSLVVNHTGVNVYVGIEEHRNVLAFAGSRQESDTDRAHLQAMPPADVADLRYKLHLELARFGVYYSPTENPYSLTYWTLLPVDETLNEAKVLEQVEFIRRADELVRLVAAQTATASLASQPSPPTIGGVWQGAGQATVSGSGTVEGQPQ